MQGWKMIVSFHEMVHSATRRSRSSPRSSKNRYGEREYLDIVHQAEKIPGQPTHPHPTTKKVPRATLPITFSERSERACTGLAQRDVFVRARDGIARENGQRKPERLTHGDDSEACLDSCQESAPPRTAMFRCGGGTW